MRDARHPTSPSTNLIVLHVFFWDGMLVEGGVEGVERGWKLVWKAVERRADGGWKGVAGGGGVPQNPKCGRGGGTGVEIGGGRRWKRQQMGGGKGLDGWQGVPQKSNWRSYPPRGKKHQLAPTTLDQADPRPWGGI